MPTGSKWGFEIISENIWFNNSTSWRLNYKIGKSVYSICPCELSSIFVTWCPVPGTVLGATHTVAWLLIGFAWQGPRTQTCLTVFLWSQRTRLIPLPLLQDLLFPSLQTANSVITLTWIKNKLMYDSTSKMAIIGDSNRKIIRHHCR